MKICTLFDIGQQDGTDYLVMEHLADETFARRCQSAKDLTLERRPRLRQFILVSTAWPEFAAINPVVAGAAVGSMTVVDACQGIDVAAWQGADWKVLSLTGGNAGLLAQDE